MTTIEANLESRAKNLDIIIEQYSDFSLDISMKKANGLPFSLVDYTGLCQIRLNSDSSDILASVQVIFEEPRTLGRLKIVLSSEITSDLNFFKGVYDLYLIKNGLRVRFLEGAVTLSKTVSKLLG